MHHSMCMYYGWPPMLWQWGDLQSFSFEGLVSDSFKLFGLGTFTFLSGFVLYYQRSKNKTYWRFLLNKIVRLAIPCAFFALAYKLIFPTMMFDGDPINGTHLWFIPMVFTCIIVTSIQLYKPKLWWVTIGLYLVAVKTQTYFSYRTIWEFVHYFPTFYMGYLFNALLSDGGKVIENLKQATSAKNKIWIGILCCLLLPIFSKIVHRCYIDGSSVTIAILIIFMYTVIDGVRMLDRGGYWVLFAQKFIKTIDNNSFAIYLLHQFFINICLIEMHEFLEKMPTLLGSFIVCCICFLCSLCLAEMYDQILLKVKNKKK